MAGCYLETSSDGGNRDMAPVAGRFEGFNLSCEGYLEENRVDVGVSQ